MDNSKSFFVDNMLHQIKDRLKFIREQLKFNQLELSKILEIRQSYLSEMETGKRPVSRKVVNKLRSIYSISTDWMYTGEGEVIIAKSDNPSTPNVVPLVSTFSKNDREFINKEAKIKKKLLESNSALKNIELSTLKSVEKQLFISNKIAEILAKENSNYASFKYSISAIVNFEKIYNGIRYSDKIIPLIAVYLTAIKYPKKTSLVDLKTAISKDFSEFEPHTEVFEELATAMQVFASKAQALAEIMGIDPEIFKEYIELTS